MGDRRRRGTQPHCGHRTTTRRHGHQPSTTHAELVQLLRCPMQKERTSEQARTLNMCSIGAPYTARPAIAPAIPTCRLPTASARAECSPSAGSRVERCLYRGTRHSACTSSQLRESSQHTKGMPWFLLHLLPCGDRSGTARWCAEPTVFAPPEPHGEGVANLRSEGTRAPSRLSTLRGGQSWPTSHRVVR